MNKREKIREELIKLSIAYPAARYSTAEIEVLTDMWSEDMEDMDMDEIRASIRRHRQTSIYFPTSAEIRNICAELRRNHARTREALPGRPKQMSESDRIRNKNWAVRIIELLSNRKAV